MPRLKKVLGACVVLGPLASCATPEVVQTTQATDRSLGCEQILAEVDRARDFEQEARKERGVTGKNVAAAVFFWPALIGTYSNTEQAIDAARDRQAYLNGLYDDAGC